MTNFEYLTKDMDVFSDFMLKRDVSFDCEVCKEAGLLCDNNCAKNMVEFLKMDKVEVKDNELSNEDWLKYYETLKTIVDKMSSSFLDVNYSINHLKDLQSKGVVFNVNQRKLLSDLENRYITNIDHLSSLQTVFSLIKNTINGD